MADEPVDISGMPDPGTIGLSAPAQVDPTAGMPDPAALYKAHHGYEAQSPEELAEFMRDPEATADVRKELPTGKWLKKSASALTGLPQAASVYNPITPVVAAVAGGVGALSGAAGAALHPGDTSADMLAEGRQRMRDWSSNVYKAAQYLPAKIATKEGGELADRLTSLPMEAGKSANDNLVRPFVGDNAADTFGDIVQDVGTLLPGFGVKGLAVKGVKGARAVKGALSPDVIPEGTTYDAAGNAKPISTAKTPPVGAPITGDSLRAQPNPIPPPEGTVADAKAKQRMPPRRAVAVPAQEPPTAPAEPTAPGMSQVPGQEPTAQPPAPAAAATPSPGDAQRGSVRLFNAPKDEGPQETPTPEQQSERQGHLDAIDELSGGMLPTRRESALTGDYNATGTDWENARVGNERMQKQLATENDALHGAMENVHNSVGSEFDNSVDPTTLGDRGRVTRGAIQAIEKHFDDATDGIYEAARETNKGRSIPKLARVEAYLNDDSNFTNDAEIGLQRAAKQRMQRLWTTGDPDKGAPPGSVNAAERLREFLNQKGKNPAAMGVAGEMKGHLDMDVAEHGGPGLFQMARALRTHKARMLEEPVGIKKLLAPSDSQGINHAIPEHKVMDYIADLPREQHEHVMNVLRAGAHLGEGELAEQSAQAIKEIQAHTISRIHDAATNDGGKWNARTFHSAAERYGRNAASTFKDRPDVLKNLKTINDAGNTLHMDKSYHGAVGQAERTGAIGHVIGAVGSVASSLAHELIPGAGRIVGRGIERATEKATGEIGAASRDKAVAQRIVNRQGERGSVQVMPEEKQPLGAIAPGNQRGAVGDLKQRDQILYDRDRNDPNHHRYSVPSDMNSSKTGGEMHVIENPGLGVRQVNSSEVSPHNRGQGWGTRMLQRAADDAHAKGQVLRSDSKVSEGQVGAYKNLAQLGYDVKLKPHDKVQGEYQSHGNHVFEVRPGKGQQPLGARAPGNQRGAVGDLSRDASNPTENVEENGSQLNIGLHQGNKGEPGFRKMSKQEVHAAIESTGAKVTKSTVLQPGKHAVQEPTLVASTDRPITDHQMQDILAKTKQSAIPQRTAQGDESMHVAPGHEQTAKEQGWDQFSPDYFMEHSGQSASAAATSPAPAVENKFPPHPAATVKDAKQSKFPGIYDDPKDIMERLPPKLEESPHMKDIFGKTRKDLHDDAIARGDVKPATPIPGMAPKGKGSAHANNVTTPENAERIRNIISAYKEHDPSGYHGMVGWYEMDPMYHSIKKILGGNEKLASSVYHKLNSYTSYASPMSSVDPEIRRGTAAATMAAEGKFDTFAKQGGMPQEKAPAALKSKNFELGNEGHAMHSTAHAGAMSRFHDTGEEARAVKTGTYRRSGDAPSRSDSEYQNTVPVGDSHWSRGAGLADVRGAAAFEGSAEGPEMKVLHQWYHDNVARHPDIDLPSTSAQAVQWGALSKETGVESPIGAPKLEIWSNQIAAAAKRAGVEPKEMWKRIVKRLASQ